MGEDIGRKLRKRCDILGGLHGRMRKVFGRNERNCCDILGGLLGRMRKDIGRNGRKCATYWEGYFGSTGELLRQMGRIPGNIGDVYIIIIRRACYCKKEGCCDI